AEVAGPADAPDEKTFMHGASDPAGRLRDLDTDGVWGEVIYPNLAFFCCFHIRSPELQIETARLYNEWVAEQFIAASERFAPGAGGAVINYVVTVAGPMETVAYRCGSGVLERHPKLCVVMVECGSGWLAWVLHAMDDAYREHHVFVRPKLALLPSEYFRRQGAVTFQRDPVGLANLPFTGDRSLMWRSDYPHPEGTWPHSQEVLARQLEGL